MATTPPIPNTDRIVSYSPVVPTSAYIIPWVVIADSETAAGADLVVRVAGAALNGTQYSFAGNAVAGLSGIWNGGTLTLVTAVSGVRVLIYSKRDPQRTGNFLEGKPLPFTTLDRLGDDVAIQVRDVALSAARAIRVTPESYYDAGNTEATFTAAQLNTLVTSWIANPVNSTAYIPPFAGSAARTIGDRLGERPSIIDFGASTASSDNLAAFNKAAALNQPVFVPPGQWKVSACPNSFAAMGGLFGMGQSSQIWNTGNNSNPTLDVNGVDGVSFKDISLIGMCRGIRFRGGASNPLASGISFLPLAAGTFEYGIWLQACTNPTILNTRFKSTGYGILGDSGFAISNLNIRGATFEDMYADAIELNSAGAITDGVTIDDIDYLGFHNWTVPQTEGRVVGLTNVQNAIINNVRFKNAAGDAAFHFEDVGGRLEMSNLVGSDCNVSVNDGVIYLLNSAKHFALNNMEYRKTVAGVGATALISTSSGGYSNSMDISNVQAFDDGGAQELQMFDFSFHTGRTFVSNAHIVGGDRFCELGGATNKSFVNCGAWDTTNGIMANAGTTSSGGTDIEFTGGHFNVRNYGVNADWNGTAGSPTRWNFNSVKFSWSGSGNHNGFLLGHSVDTTEIGTIYGTGFNNNQIALKRKSCYLNGTGWLADI